MRSGMTALAVAGGVAGVLGLTSLIGAPESVVEEYPEVQRPVVRTSLVCPFVSGEEDGRSHVGVYGLPDVPTVDDGVSEPITARPLELPSEPGATPDPEETPAEPAEPLLTLEERGILDISRAEMDEPTSVAVEGRGALAPGLTAEQSLLIREVDLHGLSTTSCLPAAREHWFVGGSGVTGKRGRLVLANPTSVAAVVDVRLWDAAGPVDAPATKGIPVPARSQEVLLLDALAPEAERVAVQITTTQGRVSAALEVRETDETTPRGMSFVPAASAPQEKVVVPGVPDHGRRTLHILAPGETDAIVSMRLFGANGPYTPVENEVITVPSGSVHEVDLGKLGNPVAVELDSDAPVTAALRVVDEPDDGFAEVAFSAAAPPLRGAATALLGRAADGFSTTLYISSVVESAGEATVRRLDEEGAVVDEREVTVPPGATVPVEMELPDDASFATAVVEPAQPDSLVVAREISAETDDGAFVDLLPLWSPPVQVSVPRVVGELPGTLDRSEE